MKKPLFITFEGIDGCGKTTQVELLKDYLNKSGLKTLFIKEPGATKLGEEVRNLLKNKKELIIGSKTELLLFNAARCELCEEIILPAIKDHEYDIIISDRFYDSTLAYQYYASDFTVDLNSATNIIKFATFGIEPDLTFYIRLSAEEADLRKSGRCEKQQEQLDRIESKGTEYQAKVAAGFDTIAKANKKRFRVIDANRSIEEVFADILKELKEHLN